MELVKLIRLAINDEIQAISELAKVVKADMWNNGLEQWTGNYPAYENFYQDYANKGLYVLVKDGLIIGSVSIFVENEAAYHEVVWERDKSLVVHRIIVDPARQGQGYGKQLIEFALSMAKQDGFGSVKIDTHPDNLKMQKLLKSMNFSYRGYLSSINRLAFEKVVE
jgi:ribosomal protein S18 acetylase RimI-like enzyme